MTKRRDKLIRAMAEIEQKKKRLADGRAKAKARAREQLDSMPGALATAGEGLHRTANPLVGRRHRVLLDEQQRLLRMTREPEPEE